MELEGIWIALDASCPATQVAIFKDGTLLACEKVEAPAMQTMLDSVRRICKQENIRISQTGGFIYCTGPGSILGIRLSIMAIKTWCTLYNISPKQVFTYASLAIAAAQQLKENKESLTKDFIVCSEWRKQYWNVFEYRNRTLNQPIEVWNQEKIDAYNGSKRVLQQRKIWTQPQKDLEGVDYSMNLLEDAKIRIDLLRPLNQWEVYTPDEKQYVTWSGERHRAP